MTKQIDDRHFIKGKLEVGAMCLSFVLIMQQIAYILAQGHLRPNFKFIVNKLGMIDILRERVKHLGVR